MPQQTEFQITDDSWLIPAEHKLSANRSARPDNIPISLLVIHSISLPPNQFGGSEIIDFFLNQLDHSKHPYFKQLKEMTVSAHLLIRRNGAVIQFVPFDQCAWHAGVSNFKGQSACNQFSIGIELEGSDDQAFTAIQYEVLTVVTRTIMQRYPLIDLSHIVGHSDIAPGRKTDPGPWFDWQKFISMLD